MSLISKIQSLISSANAVTGESRTDLTSAVQDLKDGYGGSTVTKGLVFSDYDSDGYPTKAEFVGTWTEIPVKFYYNKYVSDSTNKQFTMMIDHINIPDGTQIIKDYAFGGNGHMTFEFPNNDIELKQFAFYTTRINSSIEFKGNVTFTGAGHFHTCSLTSVTFGGEVNTIPNECFKQKGSATVEMYDFSHCSAVPPLYSVASLNCKSGCVIKIPSALSDTTLGTGNGWESQTNWSALTNVTWQGV